MARPIPLAGVERSDRRCFDGGTIRDRVYSEDSLPAQPDDDRFTITALEPGGLFIDETKLPGARMGHEHRVEPDDGGSIIRHRLYMDGPLATLYAALLGRQMRSSVKSFGPREVEISEPP